MSPLLGFKAQNHPQQTRYRAVKDEIDDRATTPEVFGPLHERFGFTLDVAAAAHNTKLPRYFSLEDDGLAQSWAGERVWCNPPYSNIRPWVEKAATSGAELVVMLLPANRTEQGWWQELVEPRLREQRPDFRCEFLAGRIRFLRKGQTEIGPNERPPFGCCLLIWGDSEARTDLFAFITAHAPVPWRLLYERMPLAKRELALRVDRLINAGQIQATTAGLIPAAASRSSVLSKPVGVPADAVDGNPPREGYSTGPVPLHDAELDGAGVYQCTPACPSCAAITTKHGPTTK